MYDNSFETKEIELIETKDKIELQQITHHSRQSETENC